MQLYYYYNLISKLGKVVEQFTMEKANIIFPGALIGKFIGSVLNYFQKQPPKGVPRKKVF